MGVGGAPAVSAPAARLTHARLDRFRAIRQVTLPIERDTTLLIGENDSGKSSLLAAVARLLAPGGRAVRGATGRPTFAASDHPHGFGVGAASRGTDGPTAITLVFEIVAGSIPEALDGRSALVAAATTSDAARRAADGGHERGEHAPAVVAVRVTSGDNGGDSGDGSMNCEVLGAPDRVLNVADPWAVLAALRALCPAITVRPLRSSVPSSKDAAPGSRDSASPRARVLAVYRRLTGGTGETGRLAAKTSSVTLADISAAITDARTLVEADERSADPGKAGRSGAGLTGGPTDANVLGGAVAMRRALRDLVAVPQTLNTTFASGAQAASVLGDATELRDQASMGRHAMAMPASDSARAYTMLLLLGALLDAIDGVDLDPAAQPILLIDDLGAGLHPSWLAAMGGMALNIPAQKIVTTHAADLLARVPLTALRRVVRRQSDVQVYAVGSAAGGFGGQEGRLRSLDDQRRVAYHLRLRTPGALMARCWLLVEGETEAWIVPELARLLGMEFAVEGIRCVEFAQAGVATMIKCASDLGIAWHVLADGDQAGSHYAKAAADWGGDSAHDGVVTHLDAPDIEHLLYRHGFDDVYRAAAGLRGHKRTAHQTDADVRHIIRAAAKKRGKPAMALAVLEAANARGAASVPPVLVRMVRRLVALARS